MVVRAPHARRNGVWHARTVAKSVNGSGRPKKMTVQRVGNAKELSAVDLINKLQTKKIILRREEQSSSLSRMTLNKENRGKYSHGRGTKRQAF